MTQLLVALALTMAAASWLCFAASQKRYQTLWGARAYSVPRARRLRQLAWLLLPLSLVPCVAAYGPGFGLLAWSVLVSAAAAVVVVALARQSSRRVAKSVSGS